MKPQTKILLQGLSIGLGLVAVVSFGFFLYRKSKKSDKNLLSIIIGDSQTPFIAKQSAKASILGTQGEQNLWKGGMGLSWLKNAVDKYPLREDVGSVVVNIGTNGGFGQKDDIAGLVSSLKEKFPNAKLFAVQGSWGWGGNKNITNEAVKSYYDKFKSQGVKIVNPPIGVVSDPHSDLPIYKEIGKSIDSLV